MGGMPPEAGDVAAAARQHRLVSTCRMEQSHPISHQMVSAICRSMADLRPERLGEPPRAQASLEARARGAIELAARRVQRGALDLAVVVHP